MHTEERECYHLGYHISSSGDIWYRMYPIINELEAYSLNKSRWNLISSNEQFRKGELAGLLTPLK